MRLSLATVDSCSLPITALTWALMVLALGPSDVAAQNTLTLSVGGEVTEFQITYCGTETREAGSTPGALVIEGEVTATGSFRGRPTVLFMAKSNDAQFENIDLYLTDLPPEMAAMPPLTAQRKLITDHSQFWGQRGLEIQAEYPTDELEGLPMEEISAKMDEMGERMLANDEEMAEALPWARVFGSITVDGTALRFEGSGQTSLNPRDDIAQFAGLGGTVTLVADCGT